MFADIQFPLTDVRPFLDEETGRTPAPVWPIVNLPDEPHKAPFVRGFGRARRRHGGGVDEWAAEDAYCDVSHALRFTQSVLRNDPAAQSISNRYCAFRRLYWDGQFKDAGSVVGRVELGFGLRGIGSPLQGPALATLVDKLLRQLVRVGPFAAPTNKATATPAAAPLPLNNAAPRLARAYLYATTRRDSKPLLQDRAWWVQYGGPLVIVEYVRDREVESLPARTVPVTLAGGTFAGIRVFLGRHTIEGRERGIWFFECDPAGCHPDTLRRLRINVTRLHSMMSTLRTLADLQLKKRIAPTSPTAMRNLNNCLSTFLPFLYQKEYMGFQWTDFLRAALTLTQALTPNEFSTLRALLPAPGRGLRSQLDLASDALRSNQPAEKPPIEWDVFIAHSGADAAPAEALYALLQPGARVFLDTKCLVLGDDWDVKLAEAQRRAYMTVVLINESTDSAYYLRSEIAAAISMARLDDQRYRVVPVYLNGSAARAGVQPYGLNLKHGLELDATRSLDYAANEILKALARTRPVTNPDESSGTAAIGS